MTTRFPNGLTTAKSTETFGDFILPDRTKAHVYWEDFDYFTAADWVITTVEAGSGSASEALVDLDGGNLLITNDDADNDSVFFNKVGESFEFEVGKKLWFEARIAATDATQSDILIGLQKTDTTPLDATDGVFFLKSDGAATVDLIVEKNNTATNTSSVATVVDNVGINLGFFYDGKSSIKIFVDGAHVGTSVTTNLPDDENMTISFGVQNGEASIKTMAIDYIMVAKER